MYAESVVIYADILFMINFSLDYLCLFITGRILNCKSTVGRLAISGFAGGLYSFLPYLLQLNSVVWLLLHLISAMLLVFIAFGKRDGRTFLLLTGSFIVSSALLGGIMTALYSLFGGFAQGGYREMHGQMFFVVLILSAGIALSYGFLCKRKVHTRSAQITVYCGNDKLKLNLLVDSGNLVTEPFSALPVIIASSCSLPCPYDNPEGSGFPFSIRAIPFSTSAGKGCFLGFRPDKIEIEALGKKPKRIDAYIGIDTQRKSYSGYDGLIPASLI